MHRQRSASMGVRIGVALLVGALLPLSVFAGLVVWVESGSQRDQALDTLRAMADIQEARAEAYERSAIGTARQLATRPKLATELRALADGQEIDLLVVEDLLRDVRGTTGVIAASVTDLRGTVVATTRQLGSGEPLPIVDELDLADTDATVAVVLGPSGQPGAPTDDDRRDVLERPPRLLVATPVAIGGRPVGAAAVELRLDPLLDLTTDVEGLGETGETLLGVRAADGDALYITPLRFDADAGFTRRVAATATTVPINVALDGEETLLADATDYRGTDVLAATRTLPDTGIGLVVKVDRDEAFASVWALWRLVLVGVVVATLLAVLVAVLMSRRLGRPIADLQEVAARIGHGDVLATADTSAPGEIGALAATLNEMGVEIAAARMDLEAEVADRTADLEEQLREVEHRNEELDAFASAVAHDLKSPLSVIKGSLDTVGRGVLNTDQTRNLLTASANAADRMLLLIDDLLTLARTGVVDLTVEDVDLGALAQQVADHLALGGIIEIAPMPRIAGDAAMLRQALQNLFDNAACYAGADGDPHIRVSIVDVDADHVAIAVDDDGRGIDPDERDAVFRPFTRGTSSAGTRGTGVGLAIVARIAERHDGIAVATASPLGGARMLVTLPRSRVRTSRPVAAPTPA